MADNHSSKDMSEVGRAIKGMKLDKAKAYLNRVLLKKDIIPFMRHKRGKMHHSQTNLHKYVHNGGWPQKSTKMMLKLLENVEANSKGQNKDERLQKGMVLSHVQVNRARKLRRRTYRAHGRMGPYVRSPCHVQIVAEAEKPKVAKPAPVSNALVTRKRAALNRLGRVSEGGGEKQ